MNKLIDDIEQLIASTPTGDNRNKLTEINIRLYKELHICGSCIHRVPDMDCSQPMRINTFGNNTNVIKCTKYVNRY